MYLKIKDLRKKIEEKNNLIKKANEEKTLLREEFIKENIVSNMFSSNNCQFFDEEGNKVKITGINFNYPMVRIKNGLEINPEELFIKEDFLKKGEIN